MSRTLLGKEVAARIGLKPSSFYKYRSTGERPLPKASYFSPGGRPSWEESVVDEFIAANRQYASTTAEAIVKGLKLMCRGVV